MLRAVVGIVVVATFIGVMMPGRTPSRADGSGEAAEPWFGESRQGRVASTSTSGSQGWGTNSGLASSSSGSSGSNGGGEVRLTREENGHFYADVEINGTSVEFMIDTGATGIAMTEEDARRAGVPLDSSDKTYVGEGAGGALTGQVVRLDRVQLGDQSASGMTAVVIDGASTNLLGQAFLARFSEVTVKGDVMTLR